MTHPTPVPDATAAAVSDEEAAAAADYLAAAISHERDLHHQADANTTGSFTVVGLVIAAASTILPHLDRIALGAGVLALATVVISGTMFGSVLLPRSHRVGQHNPRQIESDALDRVRDPHRVPTEHARELGQLQRITGHKHVMIGAGLGAYALVMAIVAAAAAAVMAII